VTAADPAASDAAPEEWERQRRAVLRTAAGVGVATGAYGVSFGALATAGGFSVAQACALSVLVFTGGSQFAFIGVIGSGGSAVSASATALLLGSRNLLYGVRLASMLGARGRERAVGAQLVIDESTAVALGQHGRQASRLGFWSTGLAVFVLWNLATLIGALGGQSLGNPEDYGLDAAVPAAFLALLAPRLRDRESWAVAVAALVVALVLVPIVPAGVPVLVAAFVAVATGMRELATRGRR
jgi:predicted branched-subunit amino acid permease